MTTLPERLKELASRMNQDGDKYDAFTLLAEAVQALQAQEVVKETTINHARDPHCCGCYVIRWNDGDPVAVCGECGVQVALLDRIVSGAPEGGEWVSVKDRLPERWEHVEVYPDPNDKRTYNYFAVADGGTNGVKANRWYHNDSDGYDNEITVTHWRKKAAAPSPTAALQAGEAK